MQQSPYLYHLHNEGMNVGIKTLGGREISVEIASDLLTVKELKSLLSEQHDVKRCKLYYNGVPLNDKHATLNSIGYIPGTFVTALELTKAAVAEKQQLTEPSSPPRSNGPACPAPCPTSPGQLDSLLPGYISRPISSPNGKKLVDNGSQAPSALHSRNVSIIGRKRKHEVPRTADPHDDTDIEDSGTEFLPKLGNNATIATLPLNNSVFQALEEKLNSLCQVHSYLSKQHIMPSFRLISQTLPQPMGITFEDIVLLAKLCPEVVHLHTAERGSDHPTLEPWKLNNTVQHALKTVDAAETYASLTHSVLPNPMHIETDGSGTVLSPKKISSRPLSDREGQEEDGNDDVIIECLDPWQAFMVEGESKGGGVPLSFKQSYNKRTTENALNPYANEEIDLIVDIDEDSRNNDTKKKKKRNAAAAPRDNKQLRQAFVFRKACVQAAALLQRWCLIENTGTDTTRASFEHLRMKTPQLDAIGGTTPSGSNQRRSRLGKAKQNARSKDAIANNTEATRVLDKPDEEEESLPVAIQQNDLDKALGNGQWHPGFDIEHVTRSDIDVAADYLARVYDARRQKVVGNMDALNATRAGGSSSLQKRNDRDAQHKTDGEVIHKMLPAQPPQLLKRQKPCTSTAPLSPTDFIDHLKSLEWYSNQIVHTENIPARAARFVPLNTLPLSPEVTQALGARNIDNLYSHQAEAIQSLLQGVHTVVSTSTASGKSFCYNIPVLEALVADKSATALFMFPTKALSQDQLRALKGLCADVFAGTDSPIHVDIYDGDTPKSERGEIRDRAQLLITNPDMLSLSILPVQQQFSRFLSNLRYVVVDEAHMYKGVFGCHTALVFRRLQRICKRLYNRSPVFVATTATVANPREHALTLLGVQELNIVSQDGSPTGPKSFVLWNPPLKTESSNGVDTGKRAKQEQRREAVRRSRQERYRGAQLNQAAGIDEDAWIESVSAGNRKLADGKTSVSVSHQTVASTENGSKLTAKQQKLAREAAALLSAAGGSNSASVAYNPTIPPRKIIKRSVAGSLPAPASVQPSENNKKSSIQEVNSNGQHNVSGIPANTMPTEPPSFQAVMEARGGRYGAVGVSKEERRSSPIVEISLLLAECVQHGLRTIAFCKTRKMSELVTAYTREILATNAPELAGTIATYRSGYSPSERREIEAALFGGTLRAVAATNALELGIDIGGLDCTLHLGFPGSIASLFQQSGRAGRREQKSVSIYVGWDGPLDQFFFQKPDQLFGRPIESAMVDIRNPAALAAHLACAAAELPLILDLDAEYFCGESMYATAAELVKQGQLSRHPSHASQLHYCGPTMSPATKISLRAIDPERYSIVDETAGGRVLEEIEESKAFYEVYDGAVYMFQGRTYLCKKVDLDSRVAIVRPADLKYYTKPVDYTTVQVTGGESAFLSPAVAACSNSQCRLRGQCHAHQKVGEEHEHPPATNAACGRALVTTRWMGFVRIRRGTGQVFDKVQLTLPDIEYQTEATYIRLPPTAKQRVEAAGLSFRDGVHAAAHALLNVLPLYVMSNANDVATECSNAYDTRYKPERLLLYDKYPGGIGLVAAARPLFSLLLEKALELVKGCDCKATSGCAACCLSTECGEYNAVLNKQAAIIVLEAAVESQKLVASQY